MTAVGRPLSAAAQPLPARRVELRWPDALSAVLAVLMVFASLGGLLLPGLYRDNTWSTAAFRGGDLATLLLAVPVLVVALVLAHRGSDRARLVWLGVLAYNVYNDAFYLFGTAFNDFFLLYAALESLSLITVIGAVSSVLAVPRMVKRIPARLVAGYMAVAGTMFAAMWVAEAVRYLTSGTPPKVIGESGIHTSIVFALDLTLIVPAFLIGAVLLWRRHPAGVVAGVAMNVLGVLYMAALAFAGGFQANAGISGTSWASPPWIELAVTSFVACWLLLRYLAAGTSPATSRAPQAPAAGICPPLIPGGSHQRPREGLVMAITRRRSGHAVANSIGIAAPAEKVFDYVTDVRREREWNPQLREAEKLTPGPVGTGTRYRVRFGRGAGTAIIENLAFDRPRSWSAVSTSRRLDVRFQGLVTPVPGGCQLAVRTELFLHGGLRALSPFLRQAMRRSWDKDLHAIKTIIEDRP